jgi:hypothetical protein
VIEDAQFTDRLTGLRLSRQGLSLLAFGVDHVGQGGVNPGRDNGGGLFDLADQVQTGPLRHLMLAMKEVGGILGAEVLRLVVPQRLGFVTGALDHGHRPPVQGRVQRLYSGRGGAIGRVLS